MDQDLGAKGSPKKSLDEHPQNLEVNWQLFCWGQHVQTVRSLGVGAKLQGLGQPSCRPIWQVPVVQKQRHCPSLSDSCSPETARPRQPAFNLYWPTDLQGRMSATAFSFFLKMWLLSGLPWWRSGWESACQCRGHGFEPWSGKIPHAAGQLSQWATTTEPAL